MLMILAALCAGAFATTGVLWFSGAGGASALASARLNKLREAEASLPTADTKTSLRSFPAPSPPIGPKTSNAPDSHSTRRNTSSFAS